MRCPLVLGLAEPTDAEDEQFAVARWEGRGFTVDVAKGEGVDASSEIEMMGSGLEDVEQASGLFVGFELRALGLCPVLPLDW